MVVGDLWVGPALSDWVELGLVGVGIGLVALRISVVVRQGLAGTTVRVPARSVGFGSPSGSVFTPTGPFGAFDCRLYLLSLGCTLWGRCKRFGWSDNVHSLAGYALGLR